MERRIRGYSVRLGEATRANEVPKRTKHPGVERRGDRLRIWFIWQGGKVHEPHPAPPTATGLNAAARDRARVVAQIETGTFVYHDWFPDSPRATKHTPSFNDVAEKWLERARPELASSTLEKYVQKLNLYWLPELAMIPITEIQPGRLKDIAATLTDISAKTFNDSLTPLRGVFDAAIDDQIITANPASHLKSRRRQKQQPDPLTQNEMIRVLGWMSENAPEWWPWFAVAFDTGMRTSEMIAMRWSDVDVSAGYARVSRAYVNQQIKPVKTFVERDAEFGELTRQALIRLRPVTQLVGPDPLLFLDPATGKIINNDKPPRLIWTRCLRLLGIRHRPAYNTRHTFATLALMMGVNIGWISRQLGHSTVKMTTDHYATWIQRQDSGKERGKLDGVFSQTT